MHENQLEFGIAILLNCVVICPQLLLLVAMADENLTNSMFWQPGYGEFDVGDGSNFLENLSVNSTYIGTFVVRSQGFCDKYALLNGLELVFAHGYKRNGYVGINIKNWSTFAVVGHAFGFLRFYSTFFESLEIFLLDFHIGRQSQFYRLFTTTTKAFLWNFELTIFDDLFLDQLQGK